MTEKIRVALAKNRYCNRQTFTSDHFKDHVSLISFDFQGNGHKTWVVRFSKKFKRFEEVLKIVYVSGFGI